MLKSLFKYNIGDIVFANDMWNVLYDDREEMKVFDRHRYHGKNIYIIELKDYDGNPTLEVYEEKYLLSNKREMLELLENERIEWNKKIDKAIEAVAKDEKIPT